MVAQPRPIALALGGWAGGQGWRGMEPACLAASK